MSKFRLAATNQPKNISGIRFKTENNERRFRRRQSPE